MAELATEWGLRENTAHPLQISYHLDCRAFTLRARGQAGGPDLAPTPHPSQPEPDGPKEAHSTLQGEAVKERPGTAILPCPNCRRPLRVPTDRGELVLTCPVCSKRWDWSPPAEETPPMGMNSGGGCAGASKGEKNWVLANLAVDELARMRCEQDNADPQAAKERENNSTFGLIYQGLTARFGGRSQIRRHRFRGLSHEELHVTRSGDGRSA